MPACAIASRDAGHRHRNHPRHAADFRQIHHCCRIEIQHLGRDGGLQMRWIDAVSGEMPLRPARHACGKRSPRRFRWG